MSNSLYCLCVLCGSAVRCLFRIHREDAENAETTRRLIFRFALDFLQHGLTLAHEQFYQIINVAALSKKTVDVHAQRSASL